MNKIFLKFLGVFICTLTSINTLAQNEFITTWKTDNSGTSGTTEITIPTSGSGYLYDVDWDNDGTFDEFGLTGDVTHDFGTAGTYTIRIQGDFPRIRFDAVGDKDKILTIDQWGTIAWSTFQYAFRGCSNLDIVATDAPDLSLVSNFGYSFDGCDTLSGNLSSWNVSGITSMFRALSSCYISADISGWDVSNVTNFARAFGDATILSDITGWQITSAENLSYMFSGNESFNQDISVWDLNGVTNIESMFVSTTNFDKDLGDWDISTVTNLDDLFNNSKLSLINYDSTLIKWAVQTVNSGLSVNFGDSRYCAGDASKSILENSYGWTFTDDGLHCPIIPLILTVKTDNSGVSSSTSFELAVFGTDNDYSVDWDNDGTYDETGLTGTVTHDFTTAGTYTIRIFDESFNGLYFNNSGDKDKLLSVDQWGDLDWQNAENAFYGCSNLTIAATDTLDTYWLSSLSGMFRDCISFDDDISNWNVESITDFSYFFSGATSFNQDLSAWDVGSGTDFSFFYEGASNFNQDLSNWDMDNAVTLESMFQNCTSFNQELNWNATNDLEILTNTFNGATIFNKRMRIGEVEKLTDATGFLVGTSYSPSFYDLLLNSWGDQGAYNVTLDVDTTYCHGSRWHDTLTMNYNWIINDLGQSCVDHEFITTWRTDSTGTSNSTSITIPNLFNTHNYDVDWNNDGIYDEFSISSNVTHDFGTAGTYTIRIRGDLSNITFANSGDRRKLISVDQWGTIPWTTWWSSFRGCENLTVNATDAPNFSAINSMFQSFRGCTNLSGNFNHWDVSSISTFSKVFWEATAFNSDISNWDVSNGTNFTYMLAECDSFNVDIGGWNTTRATNMSDMFQHSGVFNQDIGSWDVGNVENMSYMFYHANDFNPDLSAWNVSNVTDMSSMFGNAHDFNQDIGNWNVSNVTDMGSMFNYGVSFDQDIGNWDVSNVASFGNFISGTWSGNAAGLSVANYDSLLINWSELNLVSGLSITVDNSTYCEGRQEKDSIITNFGWTFDDDGPEMGTPTAITSDITVYLDNSGSATITAADIDGGSYGYCSTISLSLDTLSFDCDDIGTNTVTLTATDEYALFHAETAVVTVMDTLAPTPSLATLADVTSTCEITSLTAPSGSDNCAATITVSSDASFPISEGTTIVVWTYDDGHGNTSTQSQNVIVDDITAPVADATTLTDITDECEVTNLIYPSATDECANFVSVTNDATLPISIQGTTVVTWTYDDGHGNTSTQIQNVVITDVTAPLADSTTLSDINAECEVTSLTAPTATDNCGNVTVTNDAILPISAQGTTVVTWTYDDGHGNTSTQMQNVILSDVIAPVADSITLSDIITECEVTSLTDPTATDNCGSVTVTNDAVLPISTQGTTVVTWTYDDGHGNSVTQSQNVIIQDVTPPTASNPAAITVQCIGNVPTASPSYVIDEADNCSGAVVVTFESEVSDGQSCPETITRTYRVTDAVGLFIDVVQTITVQDLTAPVVDVTNLPTEIGFCDISLTAPTATDNCSGLINGVADVTFPINTVGTTTVTWTFTDDCGNTSTQTQDVTIEEIETGTWIASDDITLVADNVDQGVTYQWIHCSNNNLPVPGATAPNFTPVQGGDYAVIVTQDGCSDTSACVNSTVSIDELVIDALVLYPNPSVDGIIYIKTESAIEDIQVFDMMGRRVEVFIDLSLNKIDGSQLTSGKYLVQIMTDQNSVIKELILNK